MPTRSRFTVAFKRRVAEELVSRSCTLEQLSQRYDISPQRILLWVKNYKEGKLVRSPSKTEKALRARNAELTQMVAWLTTENELLKKAMEATQQRRREGYSTK